MSDGIPSESNLIPVGQPAPDFELNDQAGRPHRLADYRGSWVVLYFYPKDDTPGCTQQACQFSQHLGTFAKRKVILLGMSPDSETSHQKFAVKYELSFPLLADLQSRVCTQYGVWREKSMYGKKYMGVVRTTYLIDPRGQVAHRWDQVKVPGHDEAVLDQLSTLQKV